MSKVKVKFNKNIMNEVHDAAFKHLKERIELNYCIEHNQFARLNILDRNTMQWKIEGCCEALIDKAVKSVRQED